MRGALPRVATFNCGNASTARLVEDLARLVHEGAQVIGLQEAGDRRRALRKFLRRHPSWRIYRARWRRGGSSTPILWDAAAVNVTGWRAPLAVSRRWVGPEGAGPTYSKTKRVVQIDAQLHADGSPLCTIGNTHFIPSAGRTDLSPAEKVARERHYAEQVGVVRLCASQAGPRPFVLTADMNAEPHSHLVKPLHVAGFLGWQIEPTEGGRAIDQVLAVRARKASAAVLVEGLSSDHDAVIRDYYVPDTTAAQEAVA